MAEFLCNRTSNLDSSNVLHAHTGGGRRFPGFLAASTCSHPQPCLTANYAIRDITLACTAYVAGISINPFYRNLFGLGHQLTWQSYSCSSSTAVGIT